MICFWIFGKDSIKEIRTSCKKAPQYKQIILCFYKKLKGLDTKCPFCGGDLIIEFSKEIKNEK